MQKYTINKELVRQWRIQICTTLNNEEQEKCKHIQGYLRYYDKFKPQHNETVLSLQYCKLTSQQKENIKEWMVCQRIKTNESEYKEGEKRLK